MITFSNTLLIHSLRFTGAEFLATFISEFFESLVEKIQDSGGDIIRFAGDCRMLYDFLTFFSIILSFLAVF